MDTELRLTVDSVDNISVMQAMVAISDYCDRTMDCFECPFWKRFREVGEEDEFKCMISTIPPYYWRGRFNDGR